MAETENNRDAEPSEADRVAETKPEGGERDEEDTKQAKDTSSIYALPGLEDDDPDAYEFVDLEQAREPTPEAREVHDAVQADDTHESEAREEPVVSDVATDTSPPEVAGTPTDADDRPEAEDTDDRAEAEDDQAEAEDDRAEAEDNREAGDPEAAEEARRTIIAALAATAVEEADDTLAVCQLLDRARQVLSQARPVIDALPKSDDESRNARRDELLDHYFALSRRVEALEKAAQEADRRNLASVRRESTVGGLQVVRPSGAGAAVKKPLPRRVVIMGAVFGVLLVGTAVRLAFFVTAGSGAASAKPEIVHEERGGGVFARLRKGGELVRDLERGVPVVTAVQLTRDKDGGLRAGAEAIDRDSVATTVTFTWYKNGKVIRTDDTASLMTAEDLGPPGRYKVEAVASDGTNRSRPMVTKELEL